MRFCSDDTVLLDGFTRFIAAALKGGNAAIVQRGIPYQESSKRKVLSVQVSQSDFLGS